MLGFLAALFFGLVVFDAAFSRRRMKLFGLHIELNSLIKNACALLGLEFGLFVTMLIPAALITLLFYRTHFEVGFAALIGFRARLSYIQLQSLKFEKQIRAMLRTDLGADIKSAPPSTRSLPDKEIEASAPTPLSKDDNVKPS